MKQSKHPTKGRRPLIDDVSGGSVRRRHSPTEPKEKQKPQETTVKSSLNVEEYLLKEASDDMDNPRRFHRPIKHSVADHLSELRSRLLYSILALVFGSLIGYRFRNEIIDFLTQPLGQHLFYLSPTGGLDFLVKICLLFGFLLAIPVIIYNLFKFIEPAIPPYVAYSIRNVVVTSIGLALLGSAFAYYVSLPAALYFLDNFNSEQISSLITAQEYFTFVVLYIGGFAMLFQMPLVFSFINKVKKMNPIILMKKQRYVILGSFIIAAILTPTPDPINQVIMAVPIILLYQVSVGVVWSENKRGKKTKKKTRR